ALETSITAVNDCDFTVWPGIKGIPDLNISGFELTKGNPRSLKAPDNWRGILWGRTGCSFNGSGHWSCKTGDCGSNGLECNGRSPTPPVTLATFGLESGRTYYGVNLTSGYNLQMTMEATGCEMVGCADDLNQRCSSELKLEGGGGCKTACQVYGSPEYCCNITLDANGSCKPTVYTELFKLACPRSYIYKLMNFDDLSECDGANYTVRFCPSANAFSMIKFDRQLNLLDQLVSVSGTFTLGFFDYSYLGIWYTNDAELRRVWVTNPNKPITTNTGKHALSIDPNTGNLIIIDGDVTLINITSIDVGPNPNVTATLEENGNFRLINETNKRVLWQSFDHPTNILLPGMKLGSDITAGRNSTLTSWLSNEILHSGAFTLSWEPNYTLMIRRRGQPYWISGNLRRQKFPFLFALNGPHSRSQYSLTSVYNDEEMYFSYMVDSNTALHMWILTPKGQLKVVDDSTAWTPEFCYGYDSGDGCVKESSLPPCRTKNDNFIKQNGEFAPERTRNDTDENSSLSISDCFAKCWNDCNCVGFKNKNEDGTGCVIWIGNNSFLVNLIQNSTWKYVINTHNLISPSPSTST
ncbi:G-type lectin S-receptor-like serine/threonine-protein kinase, partial [Tanacetum coccineum]